MADKVLVYHGQNITLQYDVKRCIHAGECVRGLPGVFDPQRKPWVDPDAAPVAAVAEVVSRCPTGALQFIRQDGGPAETVPECHSIQVGADGPLWLRGAIEVVGVDGTVTVQDTRMALCRCGASKNKPFCDGSHTAAGFRDAGVLGTNAARTVETESAATLKITPAPGGPLAIKGDAELRSADGQVCYRGNRLFLCRCGASENKPFCDGSHSRIGFNTES